MESKKRPHGDDLDNSRAKKRAASDDRASPSHTNGITAAHNDEPKDGDNIELFRKEAIFRRMKHYSREAERSQARVAELERRFSTCQAGLAALEACWTQLIGTIRSLVKPEDLPSLHKDSEGINNLASRLSSDADPQYVEALKDKMQTTSAIVKAFVSLSSQGDSRPSDEEWNRRSRETETECSVLRSETYLLRAKLRDSESQKEMLHEQLIAAEKRADRSQSKSLTSVRSPPPPKEESVEAPSVEIMSTPEPHPINGTQSIESDEWRDLANFREAKLDELSRENAELREQLRITQFQVKSLPEEFILESTPYKALQERASALEYSSRECQVEVTRLKEEVDKHTASRADFEAKTKHANETQLSDLKQLLSKRELENGRLREQRDQYQAEINERKARDQSKMTASLEFKALAESRAERIGVLESENKRLKTRLAANVGDEDLVAFLWQNASDSTSYVEDLKRKLLAAEERAVALEKTLASVQGGRGDVAKSEAEAKRQLAQVQKQLEKYQVVYGDASSLPPDTAQLSEQLQRKQDEIDKLRIQDKQREEAESALFSEVDKLSSAWEALDRQVKDKVYNLNALEERISKAATERAKSENKFYQCMRDKDAVESERKKLSQNLDKAAKAIEKLTESEKAISSRSSDLEKEVVLWKKIAEAQKERGNALDAEIAEWRIRAQGERKNADEIRAAFQEHTQSIEQKRTELRKLEEGLLKSKKEVEKQSAKVKLSMAATGTSRETQLQHEVDKCMSLLKCSTCQMNIRNTVIAKCMHTFCKECVEARIATRQRKCPACNVAFSQGEVQGLFFQ